ncbi:MAG TPA: hypothetical protein VFZ25_09805, partial [Chloroflexota bacterium]|nr:hypothetical protein [Chloroflexota bacterium]
MSQGQTTSVRPGEARQAFTARLQVSPSQARVGDLLQVTGSGYPAGAPVSLVWHTIKGRYEVEGGTEFIGEQFDPWVESIGSILADQDGKIQTAFPVPTGFGGIHDLRGVVDGQEVSQAGVTVYPTITLTPLEGPIGTPIELRIVGVDRQINVNTWHVLYDNHYLGLVTAVTTDGVAVARFS